ncbi:MAG TPA: hypothetical protein VIS94_08960 [Desulfomonilia bacterium]
MKKAVLFVLPLCCMLLQCAHREQVTEIEINPGTEKECLSVFPAKPFRAVHKIEADLPFGGYQTFIGVTEIYPDTGFIKVVLLSPEGITLLDAESTGQEIKINSGMPPLNRKDFASGLADDIRFLFIKPDGNIKRASNNEDGSCYCLWEKMDMRKEFQKEKEKTVIRELKGHSKIIRQAILMPPVIDGLFSKMTLQIKGVSGYTLSFELIQTEDTGNR